MSRLALAALFALAPLAAEAQTVTGNDALEACRVEGGGVTASCYDYYLGLTEGLVAGAYLGLSQMQYHADVDFPFDDEDRLIRLVILTLGYCAPGDRITTTQMADVAVRYLLDNPATRHDNANLLAIRAWKEAFPCDGDDAPSDE